MRTTLFLFTSIAYVLLRPGLRGAQSTVSNTDWDDRSTQHNVAPVVVSDTVRETLPNDYLRVTFVPAGVSVTMLSRPGSLRAFTTATPLYSPPLKLADFPTYSGLINVDTEVLVAMRCRPRNPENVDAVLATWPNVFSAIQRDVSLNPSDCGASPTDAATQVACFANAFSDPPSAAVPTALSHTFSYAATLLRWQSRYAGRLAAEQLWHLPSLCWNGPLGKGLLYLSSSSPMTSQQILVKSISSEYVLKNVTLADGGCTCISVPPYKGRSNDRLDPDFIAIAGGYGVCATVDKLRVIQNER